jgi:hypothetical protein
MVELYSFTIDVKEITAGGVLSTGLGADSVAPCGGGGGKAETTTEQSLNVRLVTPGVFAILMNNSVSLGNIH